MVVGSVSLIPNPLLRVFAISASLKVIHAPKTPPKGGESGNDKINFLHSEFHILTIGTSHGPYKHPHNIGLNVDISENQADQFWTFFHGFV